MTNTKKAQHRVRTITGRYGLNPAKARKVQVATVQSVALYGAELRSDNQVGREQHLPKLVNESARHATAMFRTTPIVPLLKEAVFRPTKLLLNHRR
jgi:hypothetical protein